MPYILLVMSCSGVCPEAVWAAAGQAVSMVDSCPTACPRKIGPPCRWVTYVAPVLPLLFKCEAIQPVFVATSDYGVSSQLISEFWSLLNVCITTNI